MSEGAERRRLSLRAVLLPVAYPVQASKLDYVVEPQHDPALQALAVQGSSGGGACATFLACACHTGPPQRLA